MEKESYRNEWIYMFLIIAIAIIIIVIIWIYTRPPTFPDEVINCIVSNSEVITYYSCGHCQQQIEKLGIYSDKFKIIDFNAYIKEKNGSVDIDGVPTWIINGTNYMGVKTLQQLKELTNC